MGIQILPGTGSRRAYDAKYKLSQGPWSGGINTVEAATALGENELQDCVNFMFKPDGSLRVRPPVSRIENDDERGDLPVLTPDHVVTALGSVVQSNGKLSPMIAVKNLGEIFDEHTEFYHWNGSQWLDAFMDIPSSQATDSGDTGIFVKVLQYNNKYYLVAQDSIFELDTETGDISYSLLTPATTTLGGKHIGGYDGVILKNRLVVHDGKNVFYSKATDPTDWSVGGGAGVLETFASDNDVIRRMIVFQDSLWLMKNNGVYRLTWVSDPGTDGVYEKVSDEGAYDAETFNNDLFIINGKGVYKFVSSYFIEVSAKIRNVFRKSSNGLGYIAFGSGPALNLMFNKIGLFKVGSQLLCGPFNDIVPLRNGEASVEDYISNAYFVLDLDSGLWSKWQFSAYSTTNPVCGPSSAVMPFSAGNPAAPENYVWLGLSLATHRTPIDWLLPYLTTISSISAVQMDAYDTDGLVIKGQDFGVAGASWIGGLLKLGEINLGDSTEWKHVFHSRLDAKWEDNTVFEHGASEIGYIVDGVVATPEITPSAGKLRFGKGFRCKEYAFFYDSITGISAFLASNQLPELNDISAFFSVVQISSKVTAAGSS